MFQRVAFRNLTSLERHNPSIRFRYGYNRFKQTTPDLSANNATTSTSSKSRENTFTYSSFNQLPPHLQKKVQFTKKEMELIEFGGATPY